MPQSALVRPEYDPTPIFELFRGNYASELLTSAVAHFGVFDKLASGPKSFDELRAELGLVERPAVVLFTALEAMGFLVADTTGKLSLTPIAREHLISGSYFDVSGYVTLAAQSPGVLGMVERLRTNNAAGAAPQDESTPWIFKPETKSAMDQEATARHFTLALAGRAKNVSASLAERVPLGEAKLLVDAGGGTGIYAIACLQKNPNLRAIVWDRAEVLRIAAEFAEEYGVSDRLECRVGDMFNDPMPTGADVILLSNILHDWDVPECRKLVRRCADALPKGGRLLVHDVLLNDAHDGPLPIALYSAALFSVTEGRAYSAAEYQTWFTEAGLKPRGIVPTGIHCSVLTGEK